MPDEETLKHTKARCSCGVSWDTKRSKAKTYADAVEILRRGARHHIAFPAALDGNPKHPHIVTVIETKVQVLSTP